MIQKLMFLYPSKYHTGIINAKKSVRIPIKLKPFRARFASRGLCGGHFLYYSRQWNPIAPYVELGAAGPQNWAVRAELR